MDLLLGLNQQAADFERRDASSEAEKQRITVGVFFYSEPADDNPESLPG